MTTYYPHKISLSDGQKVSLARAFGRGEAVTLRFKNEAITGGSDTLHLTARQIKKIERAIKNKTGVDIDMSKTQIRHVRTRSGTLPLTLRQIKEIERAIKNKTGMDIDMSKRQIRHTPKLANGAGMRVKPPTGSGMRINPPPYMRPPPFIGSWGDQKKARLRWCPLNWLWLAAMVPILENPHQRYICERRDTREKPLPLYNQHGWSWRARHPLGLLLGWNWIFWLFWFTSTRRMGNRVDSRGQTDLSSEWQPASVGIQCALRLLLFAFPEWA